MRQALFFGLSCVKRTQFVKYTAPGLVRRGSHVASPLGRFHHSPCWWQAFMHHGQRAICRVSGYTQDSLRPFWPVRCRPTEGCVGAAWVRRPAVRFNHDPFEYSGGFYEPRVTAFRGCTQDSRGPPGPKIRRTALCLAARPYEPRTTSH